MTSAILLLALVVVGACVAATQRSFVKPTINDFTPKTGGQGTRVTITGTALAGATVEFFGVVATGVMVNAAGTSLTVSVPAPPEGGGNEATPPPGPIAVRTADGTAISTANFTYVATTTPPPATAPPANRAATPSSTKAPAGAVTYYTYRRQVKFHSGQTIHFKAGKGYYAA